MMTKYTLNKEKLENIKDKNAGLINKLDIEFASAVAELILSCLESEENPCKYCDGPHKPKDCPQDFREKSELRGALARGYCSKRNEDKVLDSDLIEDMAKEVERNEPPVEIPPHSPVCRTCYGECWKSKTASEPSRLEKIRETVGNLKVEWNGVVTSGDVSYLLSLIDKQKEKPKYKKIVELQRATIDKQRKALEEIQEHWIDVTGGAIKDAEDMRNIAKKALKDD